MSMENAILEHASALRELSAAIKTMYAGRAAALALPAEAEENLSVKKVAEHFKVPASLLTEGVESAGFAETAKVITEAQQKDTVVSAEAKKPAGDAAAETAASAPSASEQVKPDAELEAAVTHVEDAAQAEAAPLDYAKDVKPVLLALVKAKQKPALVELLAKYNAKNGEQIKADDFAAIVADANALIAA